MLKIKDKVKAWLYEEESGQGLVEYALIIALVAVGCWTALLFFKVHIITVFNRIQLLLTDYDS